MNKISLRYEQISCRLTVEGLPDVSTGQGGQAIGILTGWGLALAGHTELEGKREHLEALLQVVVPYARHLISGAPRPFGDLDNPVAIHPDGPSHRLELRSSQPNTPPLTLQLDDAELADLVRCLDQLRLDSRLQLPLQTPPPQPLKRSELRRRVPLGRRVAAPLCGLAALGLAGAVSWMVPTPKPGSFSPSQGQRKGADAALGKAAATKPPANPAPSGQASANPANATSANATSGSAQAQRGQSPTPAPGGTPR